MIKETRLICLKIGEDPWVGRKTRTGHGGVLTWRISTPCFLPTIPWGTGGTMVCQSFVIGGLKARLTDALGKRWKSTRMIADSKILSLITRRRGRWMGNWAPAGISGFFRRARTLPVDLVSFCLESNCTECLLKWIANRPDLIYKFVPKITCVTWLKSCKQKKHLLLVSGSVGVQPEPDQEEILDPTWSKISSCWSHVQVRSRHRSILQNSESITVLIKTKLLNENANDDNHYNALWTWNIWNEYSIFLTADEIIDKWETSTIS